MYALVVLVTAAGLASADVGLPYNYKPHSHGSSSLPGSGSHITPLYGAPSYPVGGSSNLYNTGYNGVNRFNYKGAGQSAFQTSNAGYQNVYNVPTNVGNSGFQSLNQFHHANQYHHKYQEGYQVQQQPALIFKHFYVHAAPDEEEPPKPRHPIVLPPPQKHYKIIFIKAPAQPTTAPQIIPVNQPNEEKTIIYVLVKKTEEIGDIVLPKLDQRPPAKPEVFFIKYNNKEGSQAVIDNIVKDYNKGQPVNVPNVGIAETPSSGSVYYPNQPTIAPIGVSQTSGATNNIPPGFGSQSFLGSDGFGAAFASSSSESSTPTLNPSEFVSHPLTINPGESLGGTTAIASSDGSGATSSAGSGFGNHASAVASSDNVNSISTSQGVPHETYGLPKFRE